MPVSKSTRGTTSCNPSPIPSEIQSNIDSAARGGHDLIRFGLCAIFQIVTLVGEGCPGSTEPAKERDLSGPELDRAMGWSAAHRRRLGITPAYFAGDEERSPRFHLDDVREELRARGPKATSATAKATTKGDDIDVSADLSRAGLHLIGGAK